MHDDPAVVGEPIPWPVDVPPQIPPEVMRQMRRQMFRRVAIGVLMGAITTGAAAASCAGQSFSLRQARAMESIAKSLENGCKK